MLQMCLETEGSFLVRKHHDAAGTEEKKKARRKSHSQTDRPASTFRCAQCGRDCLSRIGFCSHSRRCLDSSTSGATPQSSWTDGCPESMIMDISLVPCLQPKLGQKCAHKQTQTVLVMMLMALFSQTRIFGKVDGQFWHVRWRLLSPILDAHTLLQFGQKRFWLRVIRMLLTLSA